MRLPLDRKTLRFARFMAAMTLLAALCLACMAEVEGDRASSGTCPAGEKCSEATPMGLRFVGHGLYDQEVLQLGPILAGGTFDVGLRTADGQALPPFAVEVEDTGIFTATRGDGVFGPTDATGEPLHVVDGHVTVRGARRGTTFLRITDPATGDLFDRLPLDIFEITDVEMVVAQDAGRDHLYSGCEEMVGVRLIANDGETELRAFDQSVIVRAEGDVQTEPRFWDCVSYTVPEGRTEASFEVTVAGRTFTRTMPVRTLADDGLSMCPPVRRD